MCRMMQAAALATIVALFAGRGASAQEPQRPMESDARAMQDGDHLDGDHLTEAVKQTQAAIDAGNSGQTSLVVEHAEQALTHARAVALGHVVGDAADLEARRLAGLQRRHHPRAQLPRELRQHLAAA